MNVILSEDFGLYRVQIRERAGQYFWKIIYLDEGGEVFGHESNAQPHPSAYEALKPAMHRLADLIKEDGLEETKLPQSEGEMEIAGNGTRTRDILLGKNPIISEPSQEVEK